MSDKINNFFDFLLIFFVVGYDYLRMLGMNDKSYIFIYLLFLILLTFIKIVNLSFTKREFINVISIFLIVIFSSVYVGEVNFLVGFLVAISFFKTDLKKFLKNFLLVSCIWYIFVVSSYFLGLVQNNSLIRVLDGSMRVRNSLGFDHVNNVFLYFLPIVLTLYLLKPKNLKIYSICIFLVSLLLYWFSDCRTGFYCILLFLLFINFSKFFKSKIFDLFFKYSSSPNRS